jgi:cytochrome c oxidase subunit 3
VELTKVETPVEMQFDDPAQQREASALGMWAFLASEVLFFGGVFTGYSIYRWKYPQAFAEASHHLYEWIGAVNTAILLTSSLFIALAVQALHTERPRRAWRLIIATLICGLAFLSLKAVEYWMDYQEGLVPGVRFDASKFAEPGPATLFFTFYFSMTGLHAAHVISGLLVLTVIGVTLRRAADPGKYANSLENGALFWHLVDIIWIFLFPLLYLIGGPK